ncbi:MAG: hypothetical protein KME54_16435 [Tolypothrix brevis GSE-NOS-MK-07-07A]|nr:hypothetical protein [Tolypothrix brevis GSE-NOS-MK-07-07A]
MLLVKPGVLLLLLPLLLGLTTVAIALTATPTFSQSSSNNSISFGCETIENTPTTVVYNPQNQNQKKALINWKKEYINSQNLDSDCKHAAEILKNRYEKEELGLWAFEPNSKNGTGVVCLISQPGKSCNLSGEELLSIKTVNTEQNLYDAFITVVDPNLIELDKNTFEKKFRANDRTYIKMKPRSFWQRIFN